MKITEKVSFNIASEASYVYIFSGQKFSKNAKHGPIWRFFESLKLAVLPDRSVLIRQKLVEKANIQRDILGDFQTLCFVTMLKKLFLDEFAP